MNRADLIDYVSDCALAIVVCAIGFTLLTIAFVGACGMLGWERVCR